MGNGVDILIKGGLIYDGRPSPPYPADILISGRRIHSIGTFSLNDADLVLDARGLAVAPGFIDVHAHSDFTLMADPRAEGKLCQGVTTEINGNCGMSAAPLMNKAFERREDDLRELDIRERWNTLREYFDLLEKRSIALNVAILAGHGNIRGSVIGYDDRSPSPGELAEMARLLAESVEQGAIGISTGLIYPPGIYSKTEELIALACSLEDKALIYTSHMRSEGTNLVDAVGEVLRIGRESGVKVHISHIKTAGMNNWHKADEVIAMLMEAIAAGLQVSCDRYPYTASSTDLDSILPSWAFDGGNEMEIRRLKSEAEREKIGQELKEQSLQKDYWERILVSSVSSEKNRWMEGKTMAAIAGELNMDAVDTVIRVLAEERLRVGAIFFSMSEENLRKFLSLPFCMIGSDSSARSFDGPTKKGSPHPRGFGTFPRLFRKYVKEDRLIPFEDAVYKSTMLAARTFGLTDRGEIRKGMYADMVIFDPETVKDKAGFDDPFRKPEGIRYVLVNGCPAIWEGRLTGRRAGRVLRRTRR
jgi:N-acyl-D-amino-acid deacylase